MKRVFISLTILTGILVIITACGAGKKQVYSSKDETAYDFTIAFGSCDDEDRPNHLWDEVLAQHPDVWIWGGDNIYADTENMQLMKAKYALQLEDATYQQLRKEAVIMGTWDDHDYGLNDGGEEYTKKGESQQLLLDFLDVPKNSKQRQRKGVYASRIFGVGNKSIKVIILDTRYFRTGLQKDPDPNRRYQPQDGGTILGDVQWKWLTDELRMSKADFHIIMSSIQVLSKEHGYERWATFSAERTKLLNLIASSEARNVILLSGDRHISEFSVLRDDTLAYPLMDFTSSGLTHAYKGFTGEPNQYREGAVVFTESFGMLQFDLEKNRVVFTMMGDDFQLLQQYQIVYPN